MKVLSISEFAGIDVGFMNVRVLNFSSRGIRDILRVQQAGR